MEDSIEIVMERKKTAQVAAKAWLARMEWMKWIKQLLKGNDSRNRRDGAPGGPDVAGIIGIRAVIGFPGFTGAVGVVGVFGVDGIFGVVGVIDSVGVVGAFGVFGAVGVRVLCPSGLVTATVLIARISCLQSQHSSKLDSTPSINQHFYLEIEPTMNELRPEHHAVQLQDDANKAFFASNNKNILSIRIIVHTTGRWANSNMSDNHVTILLLLEGNNSIQLNMATDEGDTLGVFIWALRAWQESNSAITSLDIALQKSCTVGNLYQILREAGMHRYQFSGGGSGCRHWV